MNNNKTYKKVKTKKLGMSQLFDETAQVIPYTKLLLKNAGEMELFSTIDVSSKIMITGVTKGCGFAGGVKRWGFAGGPKTHGQSDRHRAIGSIGTQGQGRVIPGKKMPGRMGGRTKTIKTIFLGVEKENVINVKGGVPGSRNSEVIVYLPTKGSKDAD